MGIPTMAYGVLVVFVFIPILYFFCSATISTNAIGLTLVDLELYAQML